MEDVQGHGVVHVVNDYPEHGALGRGHRTLADSGAAERRVCCLHSGHGLEDGLGTLHGETSTLETHPGFRLHFATCYTLLKHFFPKTHISKM